MDTHFSGFRLTVAVNSESPVRASTSRATITFLPNEEGQLTGAEVIVHDCRNNEETQQMARKELIKAILAKLSPTVRIISGPSRAHEIAATDEEIVQRREGHIILHANFTIVREYSEEADDLLQIDIESDSEAIYAYYTALTKTDPFDKFGDLFKVIEFLAGTGKRRQLPRYVNSRWWIPNDIIKDYRKDGTSKEDAIKQIIDDIVEWRGKCRHLKPGYHFRMMDDEDKRFIESKMYVMESIARLSLEKNPDTCKK